MEHEIDLRERVTRLEEWRRGQQQAAALMDEQVLGRLGVIDHRLQEHFDDDKAWMGGHEQIHARADGYRAGFLAAVGAIVIAGQLLSAFALHLIFG